MSAEAVWGLQYRQTYGWDVLTTGTEDEMAALYEMVAAHTDREGTPLSRHYERCEVLCIAAS